MTRTLRKGHRGPDVRRWQEFLERKGHSPGKIDGSFGEKTAAATRAFQTANGLTADAVVGPKTLAKAAELGLRSLRRLTNSELTPALIAQARKILGAHHADPYGTEIPFEIDEVHYVARIEEHYHPPGGPRKPWGYHPGVSLFLDAEPDRQIEAPDDATEPAAPPGTVTDEAPALATRAVIVLDPGHGGTAMVGSSSPNNATSPSGVSEKELTLRMAELVRASVAAQAVGVRVELTRSSDVNLGLADRARAAGALEADLFLSLHFNGFDGKARGVETWIRSKGSGNVNHADDLRFAQRVLGNVHEAIRAFDTGTKNRGVKESGFGVLRDDLLGNSAASHPCRACLLEIEFLDAPKVDELFNTGARAAEVRERVAAAIARALLDEIES